MPRIKMSPSFTKQQSHFRFNIYDPGSCGGAQAKIDNLRNELNAIKKHKEEALAIQDQLEFYNEGILIASLIKETSYSFLDLAVSIGSAFLPPPMAKKVEIVGNAGMGSIDMAATLSEYSHGQAAGRDVLKTGIGALNKNLPVQDNFQKVIKYGTSQNLEMIDYLDVARKGDTEKTRKQVQTAGTNMSLDSVILKLDTMPDDTPNVKHLKAGISTVKAAKRYGDALENTFDGYLEEKERITGARFAIKQQIRRQVEGAEKNLDKALKEFSHCMVR